MSNAKPIDKWQKPTRPDLTQAAMVLREWLRSDQGGAEPSVIEAMWSLVNAHEAIDEVAARADEKSPTEAPAPADEDAPLYTWCPECGPDMDVDEDGCCVQCGATATGPWADKAHALYAENQALQPVPIEWREDERGHLKYGEADLRGKKT